MPNQPKSTVELGYMCLRGLSGPPAVTITKKLKYVKKLLLRCIHHFISDLINNMDHMRISGTDPRQWFLAKQSSFKSWKVLPKKCPKNKPRVKDMKVPRLRKPRCGLQICDIRVDYPVLGQTGGIFY